MKQPPHIMRMLSLWAMLALGIGATASAQEIRTREDDKGIFNLVWENDIVAGTDRGYTNGVRASWLSSEQNTPTWINRAASILPSFNDGNKRISAAIGQSMYAPDNLLLTTPDPNDRPYAGWLYGSLGVVSDTGQVLDNMVLTLGVVGPLSYAEQTQNYVHRITDSDHAYGWDHQLKNEPGVMLTYERKWRGIYEASAFGLGADIVPHVGANLGNINTSASIGTTLRVGYDLPADYGPPRIRPSLPGSDFFYPTKEVSGYLFTTIGGQAVARDIFLDGNTFTDSPSVDKKNFVGSLQLGGTMIYGDARLSYTHVFMTKQFDTEAKAQQFGALTFSYRF